MKLNFNEGFNEINHIMYNKIILKEFFFSSDAIEKLDIKPLKDLLEQIGGWPVTKANSWPSERYQSNWLKIYIKMRQIGFNADSIVELRVGADFKNNSRLIVYVDQPKFNLNSKQINASNTENYYKLMVQIAEMMNANKFNAQNEMSEVLDLEKDLIDV
jgi:hypothetical protein